MLFARFKNIINMINALDRRISFSNANLIIRNLYISIVNIIRYQMELLPSVRAFEACVLVNKDSSNANLAECVGQSSE